MVADSQPGHIDQIKQTNAGAVYRLIDQLGPVSRIDLSRLAQLAPASITKIVREMLEAHLVQETEIQEPGSRGRPAVGLVVETEAWHYLSLRISRGEIFLALRDLSSKLVVEDRLELPLNAEQPLLDAILTHIDQFFIRHQQRLERLTAIAITLPGIIVGTVLAFARSLGEFGATITFVSNIPGETRTIPSAMYTLIQTPGGESAAARLCIISIILALISLLISEWLARVSRERTGR